MFFLTPELEKFVRAKIESGLYNSASEVIRDALRLLEEHENMTVAGRPNLQDLTRSLADV